MRHPILLMIMLGIAEAGEACIGAPSSGRVELPGSPFKIVVSSDGCSIYASLAAKRPGLAMLKRSQQGALSLVNVIKTNDSLTGLVLTHDAKTIIATTGKGIVFIDPAKAEIVHEMNEEATAGKVYTNLTPDGLTLFVSNERAHSITVIDLPKRSVIGRIPTGNAPIALTFSPDGKWLYTTSQAAMPDWDWPAVCDPENPAAATGKHPKGAILVVDVAAARKDPAHAVASRIEAGCNPVRLALSPDGARAYVTTRKDNAVLVFDVPKFILHATIAVGTAPVPVAVVNNGTRLLVGNSNRFGGADAKPESISVIDTASFHVVGKLDAGAFPRDIVPSPDGKTIYVANFGSNSIDVLDTKLSEPRP